MAKGAAKSSAVHDTPVKWPMAGASGRATYNKATKVPVVKTSVVGQFG